MTVSRLRLAGTFAVIGASSFGGGLTGYLRKALVEEHRWLSDEEFLRGLSLAQAVPGPNAVNLAVYVGHRLHGVSGAFLAVAAVLAVPVVVLSLATVAWARWGALPAFAGTLRSLGAVGVGLMVATGVAMFRSARLSRVDLVLAAAAFVAVGVLRWPVPAVLLTLVPLSVWLRR